MAHSICRAFQQNDTHHEELKPPLVLHVCGKFHCEERRGIPEHVSSIAVSVSDVLIRNRWLGCGQRTGGVRSDVLSRRTMPLKCLSLQMPPSRSTMYSSGASSTQAQRGSNQSAASWPSCFLCPTLRNSQVLAVQSHSSAAYMQSHSYALYSIALICLIFNLNPMPHIQSHSYAFVLCFAKQNTKANECD